MGQEIETLIEGHENLTRRLYLELRQERVRHDVSIPTIDRNALPMLIEGVALSGQALRQRYMDLGNYCHATERYLRNERAERQEIEMQMRDLEKTTVSNYHVLTMHTHHSIGGWKGICGRAHRRGRI